MNQLEMRISAAALRDASREIRRNWERSMRTSTKGASIAMQIAEWLSLRADQLEREAGE